MMIWEKKTILKKTKQTKTPLLGMTRYNSPMCHTVNLDFYTDMGKFIMYTPNLNTLSSIMD